MNAMMAEQDDWRGRIAGGRGTGYPIPQGLPPAQSWLAFAGALPIAFVGGLIGLGGAECRFPLLAGPLRYSLREAVPVNLAVSLVTLLAASVVRLPTLHFALLHPVLPAVLAAMTGAMGAVPVAARAVSRLPDARLAQTVRGLLMAMGVMLIAGGWVPLRAVGLIPAVVPVQLIAGLLLGVVVGVVSGLLGIAGGALLIPMFVFAYGLDIATAGTVSLLISLPIVAIGVARWARFGAYHQHTLRSTIAPMGASSVIGAMSGGLLVGLVPAPLLSVSLGTLLIGATWRTVAQARQAGCAAVQRSSRVDEHTPA